PAAVQADDDAFEHLDAFLVAFADLHVHADRIAGLHRRPLGQLRLLHQIKCAHNPNSCLSAIPPTAPAPRHPEPHVPATRGAVPAFSPAIPVSATGGFP